METTRKCSGGCCESTCSPTAMPREGIVFGSWYSPGRTPGQRKDKEENHAAFLLAYPLKGCRAFLPMLQAVPEII